jgi:hypothetical protein
MHSPRLAALATALLLALAAPSAFALTIDSFTNALPPNPCLPASAQEVIFQGVYCDGTTCPPDPFAACQIIMATQAGLSGVLASATRTTRVATFSPNANIHGRITSSRLEVGTDEGRDHWTYLTYYGSSSDLDLDLVAAGVASFELSIGGDPSPALPLYLKVLLVDFDGGTFPDPTAEALLTVTAPGPVSIPLSSFTLRNGIDLRHVDIIAVTAGDCPTNECAPLSGPRSYWIGPLSLPTVDAPTRTNASTWGVIKASYR